MNKDLKLIKKLAEGFGVSGFESGISLMIKKELIGYGFTFESDNLGSFMVHYRTDPTKPHIAFFTHIDEVGFIVNKIENDGFIRFSPIGGFNKKIVLSERVLIRNKDGSLVPGLIASDINEKNLSSFEDFYIDVGTSSKEETLALGVAIGSPIEFDSKVNLLSNNLIVCKALDDRLCAYSLVMAMKKLAKSDICANITAVFSVQEEVGCRGAQTASQMLDMEFGFALDVTDSFDIPDGNPMCDCRVNNGIALSVIDGATIAHRGLLKVLMKLFDKEKIKYTFDPMDVGGTDSSKIHLSKNGVSNITISLPVRYMHSPNTVGSLKDASTLTDVILLIAGNFDWKLTNEISYSKFSIFG